MQTILPPEATFEFLGAAATRLDVEKLLVRDAVRGGFVFSGPDGIGKATLAYMLAATVLSGGTTLGESDPKVRGLLAAGAHPDVRTLKRTQNEKTGRLRSEIDVDAVRGLIERLQQTSTTGRSFVIIDLADDLGRSASNSLLKILEEPPKGTALFLLSQSPSSLLPTLTSRCRRLALRPVAEEPLARWLATKTSCSEEEAGEVACASGGAPGKALRMAAGEIEDILALADTFLNALEGKADLLVAAKKFAARDAELSSEGAQDLILSRFRQKIVAEDRLEDAGRYLEAYDRMRDTFLHAGTADRAQTAYLAGVAARDTLRRG